MEKELLKLDVSNVDKLTLDFMEKLSSVTLDDNKLLTPEELIGQFRKSFNIQGENEDGHNIMEDNEDGVLCFDLMICANPLSKKKKQLFYTFFSTKDVSDSKKALAKLYEYYLNKKPEYGPEYGIDTMLQICYSASEIEKRDETKGKSIKKGVMLDFTKDGRMSVCIIDQAEKEFNLEKGRIKENESVRKTSATINDDSQRFEVLENYIKSVVNDDKTKSSYSSYVDAFLDITSTDADSCLSEEDIQKNAYRISLINELAVPGLKRLYFVPIPFPNDSLIGHIVVSTNGTKAKDEEIKLINKYKTLAFILMFPLVQANISMFYMRNQRREAIKSAKAAIMSRNLSHNLGSHVMSYMKQSLTSVEEMVKSGALEQVHKKTETISNEMPFLVGMGKFISYLQERQDYIATVSTDYIPYPSIVNFKDSIYDELNPDYRFHRHSEHRSGFKPANLLLENIAKSEGLSRKTLGTEEKQEENNIFINYKEFNGINQGAFQDATDAYDDLRKWNFSLPGGIMGRQAVFSIVENVIRNAAKHGKRNKGENLTVTFDIIDPLACSDEIREDSFFNRFLDSSNKDYGDLYIVTLTASTQADEGVIGKIKTAIDDASNPVDDDFNLKQSNKGIKEMFISASWLRSLRIEDMDQADLDKMSPILEVREYKGELQYVFCLPKVKEVAVVSDSIKVDDDTLDLMRRCGWRVLPYQVYLDPKTKKNYNFVIIDDASKMEEIRKCSHNNFFVASDYTDFREHRIKTKIIEDIRNSRREPNTFAITEDSLKEAEIKLYKELSACKEDISIAICDIGNIQSYQKRKKNKEAGIEIVENEAAEKTKEYRYFYRKHNDSEKEFKDFIEKIYGIDNFKYNLEFVEGISGGNSTDRLVRHSELDDTWAYKQIHAMRTKVAIFDERIFAKFAGFDPNERTSKKENGWSARLKDINDVKEARDKIKKYAEECGQPIKDARQKEIMKCKTMDEIVSYAVRYYPLNEGSEEKSIMPLVLNKKGIDVYTLIPESDTNGFEIWGYDGDSFSGDNQSINFGEVRKLGEFSLRDEDGHWSPEIRMKSNYHQYLTIHQGLLDKIYEKMKDEERNQSNKLKVTQKLYNAFGYGGSTESDWLQGLVIHSGRSKPNAIDMPQNQPFIQYSALENAVYDCKYTLVELLDYACFEGNE